MDFTTFSGGRTRRVTNPAEGVAAGFTEGIGRGGFGRFSQGNDWGDSQSAGMAFFGNSVGSYGNAMGQSRDAYNKTAAMDLGLRQQDWMFDEGLDFTREENAANRSHEKSMLTKQLNAQKSMARSARRAQSGGGGIGSFLGAGASILGSALGGPLGGFLGKRLFG